MKDGPWAFRSWFSKNAIPLADSISAKQSLDDRYKDCWQPERYFRKLI